MRSILFRTMEPMMFRGASEFSPTSRGPQTGAWSKPLPPPSTIVGALATLILQFENQPPPRGASSAWYEEVIGIFGGKGSTALKGPYLMDGEGVIYVQHKDGVLPFNKLMSSLTKGKLLEAAKGLNKVAREFELGRVDSVGIKLSDKKKAIGEDEKGLIYSTAMVDYGRIGKQRNVISSVAVEVLKASDSLEKALEAPKIIRLGGEGRLVEVVAKELQPVSEFIRAQESRTRRLRLYVATPMLFEASPSLFSKGDVEVEAGALFLSSGLNGKMSAYLNEVGFKVTHIKVVGSVGTLGGFSVAKATRKPVYATLYPSSVIEVAGDLPFSKEDCYKLYSEGLGLFRDLGYGTVIPIPITNHA